MTLHNLLNLERAAAYYAFHAAVHAHHAVCLDPDCKATQDLEDQAVKHQLQLYLGLPMGNGEPSGEQSKAE